jgi:acyl-coenzyme A synthetase/AMP-(fatty) acid ligase
VKEVREAGARQIGPVAAFKIAVVVSRLPKTRSGKILRGTMVRRSPTARLQDAGHHRRPRDP